MSLDTYLEKGNYRICFLITLQETYEMSTLRVTNLSHRDSKDTDQTVYRSDASIVLGKDSDDVVHCVDCPMH